MTPMSGMTSGQRHRQCPSRSASRPRVCRADARERIWICPDRPTVGKHAHALWMFRYVVLSRNMTRPGTAIRFQARLLRPAGPVKGNSWMFLVLPKNASAKLPTRAATTVEGVLNGHPFKAMLEPDGKKSHWLKVTCKAACGRRCRRGGRRDGGNHAVRRANSNPGSRPTCGRHLPPRRGRGRYGPRSRPPHAGTGSTGSSPPSGWRRARDGSTMPAKCWRPASDAYAASIGQGSTAGTSALLKRRQPETAKTK